MNGNTGNGHTPAAPSSGGKGWLLPALGIAAFVGLVALEHRRPLRRRLRPPVPRAGENLALAAAAALALRFLETPVVEPLAAHVARRRWGLVPRLGLLPVAETALAVALMDYTLYVWHVLLHKWNWLWRSHLVHHTDLDLDATTALRFHLGELVPSVLWRSLQIFLIGTSPRALRLWQGLTMASVAFHHSNLRLPRAWDRRLQWLIVTPRLHGIHHSTRPEETGSNWSSGLTIWDRLHGTLRRDVPQGEIVIGVPAYRDAAELTMPRLFVMPFRRQRPAWDGPLASIPRRRVRYRSRR